MIIYNLSYYEYFIINFKFYETSETSHNEENIPIHVKE